VTPSAISQAIRALEARVGAALFIRTTRSVGLTEAGERFHSRAKPAFEELVAASEVARDLGTRPAGLFRLSVPRAVVPLILEPGNDLSKRTQSPLIPAQAGIQGRLQSAGSPSSRGRAEIGVVILVDRASV